MSTYLTDEELPPLLTDERIDRIAKTIPLEGCDQQKMGWGIGYSKESDFLEPNVPRVAPFFARAIEAEVRAAIAAYLRKHGEPVAAQHRFRHPQKGTPDWSMWQPCKVRDRPVWEIDSQGYEVEYRALYTVPPLTDQERQDAARGRWMVANGGWIRSERDGCAYMTIRLPFDADLSCLAMRRSAIDAAMSKEPGHE